MAVRRLKAKGLTLASGSQPAEAALGLEVSKEAEPRLKTR